MVGNTDTVTIEYSDMPSVVVFADAAAAARAAQAAVIAAGGRVIATLPIADAVERIENQARVAAIVAELDEGDDGAAEALFAQLDAGARAGRFASVVIVPPSLIDAASARIEADDVTLLCQPTEADRHGAIARALNGRGAPMLLDIGSLKEVADEVARLAKTLQNLAAEDVRSAPDAGPGRPAASHPSDAALLRAMIRARRLRAQFFPDELFADPAWDMLLDLAAAMREGRAVAVSSLCIASAVPPTTALRWIKTLTDGNLFRRVADSSDGRRVFIELTDEAQAGMIAYLAAVQRIVALAV